MSASATLSALALRVIQSLCLFILLNGLTFSGHAIPYDYDRPISSIEIIGNEKTQTRFILKWSELYTGQILTHELLIRARQNIRDTSLFKEVKLQTLADGGQIRVKIEVQEKYFNLLLPRLGRNSNGDVKAGMKLRMYNIAGADQSMSLLVEKTDLSNGEEDQRFRLDYKFPQYSRPYFYRWRLSQSVKNTNDDVFDNTEFSDSVSFGVARDLHTAYFRRPITVTTGIRFQQVDLDQPYPEALNEVEAGNFNSLEIQLEYDDIHEQRYRRFGRSFSVGYRQGLSNSDYQSRISEFEYLLFRPLNARNNFNSRLFLGVSRDSPFNSTFYNLGGGDNVRGLERDFKSGDVLLFANFEYVIGYLEYPSYHTALFLDVGNVYPDSNSVDLDDLYSTFGFGMRWKLTSFIKTDLFIDIGYDPDSEEARGYAGTSLHF